MAYIDEIISQCEELIKLNITSSSSEFKSWKNRTERYLYSEYGKESIELKQFNDINYSLSICTFYTEESEFVNACHNGLKVALEMLNDLKRSSGVSESDAIESYDNTNVFIIHGHDGELKESVARTLEKFSINPIILSEQENSGQTIIEKFENSSDVGCAIALFTADDKGKGKNQRQYQDRARQNVVFETGYFMGKIGRDRLIIIADRGIEIPSDLQGVLWTDSTNWKFDLAKQLKTIGYDIDLNKLV